MDTEELIHKRTLLDMYKNSLRLIELQIAQHGLDIPVKLQNELNCYTKKVQDLNNEIKQIELASVRDQVEVSNDQELKESPDAQKIFMTVFNEMRYNLQILRGLARTIKTLSDIYIRNHKELKEDYILSKLNIPDFDTAKWEKHQVIFSSFLADQQQLSEIFLFQAYLSRIRKLWSRYQNPAFDKPSLAKAYIDTVLQFESEVDEKTKDSNNPLSRL